MEDVTIDIFEPYRDYLDSLPEDQQSTAVNFILDNTDCGLDVIKMAVEIQHA